MCVLDLKKPSNIRKTDRGGFVGEGCVCLVLHKNLQKINSNSGEFPDTE